MSDKDKPGVFIDLNTGDVSGEPTEKDMEALRKYAESAGIAIGQSKKAAQKNFKHLDAIFEEFYNSFLNGETRKALEKARDYFQPLQAIVDEISDLQPYIEQELEKRKPGMPLHDYLEGYTLHKLYDLRNDPNSDFSQLIEAAKRAKESTLPQVEASATTSLNTPLDRYNFLTWDNFKETGGQIAFDMRSELDKRKDKPVIHTLYSLTFGDEPGIKFTKELDHFDRRLYQAVDSIYLDANIMTDEDISLAMGGSRNPSESRRRKINNSLTKLGSARIYINNREEAEAYNYPSAEYDENILSFTRISGVHSSNGHKVRAINLLKRPILMAIADERNQMSKVPIEVLQSGVPQTERNLRIEDYLLNRILREKNELNRLLEAQNRKYTQGRQAKIRKQKSLTITLDKFYDRVGVSDKGSTVKKRAKDAAEKYLTHYKKVDYIAGYKFEKDKIIITLPIR